MIELISVSGLGADDMDESLDRVESTATQLAQILQFMNTFI